MLPHCVSPSQRETQGQVKWQVETHHGSLAEVGGVVTPHLQTEMVTVDERLVAHRGF